MNNHETILGRTENIIIIISYQMKYNIIIVELNFFLLDENIKLKY
jgi:hypothetical protein